MEYKKQTIKTVENRIKMYMNMTPLARLGYNMSCIWMRNKKVYRYMANMISFSMEKREKKCWEEILI